MPVSPSVMIFPQVCYGERCIGEICVLSHSKLLLQVLEHVAKARSVVLQYTRSRSSPVVLMTEVTINNPPEPAQHSAEIKANFNSGQPSPACFCVQKQKGKQEGSGEAVRKSPGEEGSLLDWRGAAWGQRLLLRGQDSSPRASAAPVLQLLLRHQQ